MIPALNPYWAAYVAQTNDPAGWAFIIWIGSVGRNGAGGLINGSPKPITRPLRPG